MKIAKLVVAVAAAECVLAAFLSRPAEAAERRLGLVIGESAYGASPLATAANDAGFVAQTLQAAGFDVVGARDLDAESLRATFREFVEKVRSSGPETVAFIYFSGYGMQVDGQNYLVPVDARIERAADAPLEAIRLEDITKPLAALPAQARMIFLDAARPNPFAKSDASLSGGLALTSADDGELLAFNAAPGTVGPVEQGPYGAYAKALVEMIRAGNPSIDESLARLRLRVQQVTSGAEEPWDDSRLSQSFEFFERGAGAPPATDDKLSDLMNAPIRQFNASDAFLAACARDTIGGYEEFLTAFPRDSLAKRVRAILAVRREEFVWRRTVVIGTAPAYWSYLSRYPRGPHALEARRALGRLDVAVAPPENFAPVVYDVAPPPPDEFVYLDRPYVYLADPIWALPIAPSPPTIYLEPAPAYIVDLPPPPPPIGVFVLPFPAYHPVPDWLGVPRRVEPPQNIVFENLHNSITVGPAGAVVVDPRGRPVSAPAAGSIGVVTGGAAAAAAASIVALPAVVSHIQGSRPKSLPKPLPLSKDAPAAGIAPSVNPAGSAPGQNPFARPANSTAGRPIGQPASASPGPSPSPATALRPQVPAAPATPNAEPHSPPPSPHPTSDQTDIRPPIHGPAEQKQPIASPPPPPPRSAPPVLEAPRSAPPPAAPHPAAAVPPPPRSEPSPAAAPRPEQRPEPRPEPRADRAPAPEAHPTPPRQDPQKRDEHQKEK